MTIKICLTMIVKDEAKIIERCLSSVLDYIDYWIICDTGSTDVNLFGANGQNDWEKGLGSALTYAERYFLLKYFHIATDEDDIDNPDRKKDSEPIKPVPLQSKDVLIKQFVSLAEKSTDPKVIDCIGKVSSFNETQLKKMIERLGGK